MISETEKAKTKQVYNVNELAKSQEVKMYLHGYKK